MRGSIARKKDTFAFIRPDGVTDRNGDYFFHPGALAAGQPKFDEVREGQSVEFDHDDGPKGPRASNVRML